jgi:hypothetical protein
MLENAFIQISSVFIFTVPSVTIINMYLEIQIFGISEPDTA